MNKQDFPTHSDIIPSFHTAAAYSSPPSHSSRELLSSPLPPSHNHHISCDNEMMDSSPQPSSQACPQCLAGQGVSCLTEMLFRLIV